MVMVGTVWENILIQLRLINISFFLLEFHMHTEPVKQLHGQFIGYILKVNSPLKIQHIG